MNKKKRVIAISILFIFIVLLVAIITSFENNLVAEEEVIEDRYTPFRNISNFKNENKERYVAYYENNKSLDYEDVVTYVNIGLDREYYSYISNADVSKGNLILVNKYIKLDQEYIPNNLEEINSEYFINGNNSVRMLVKEAKEQFEKMSSDSIKNNTPVYGQSAYRSYDQQQSLYDNAVENYGDSVADTDTARPGHSEHQTGLAIDVSSTKSGNMLTFGNTLSYEWMINNAHKYGFILRYPKEKENIHGYINEPWHYRYVGVEIATDMHDNYSDLTYDEYYYKFIDK